MAKEWILNSAMNRFQLNFKRNVGPTSESIRKCAPKDINQWQSYYFEHVRSKEHIEDLGQKLYVKITEVIQAEVEQITEQDCVDYMLELVINRTFDGYKTEIDTIYGQLQHILAYPIEPAPDEWDRHYNVDFYIEIKGKYIGLQIKPIATGVQLPEIFKEYALQAESHKKFTQKFGGRVFYLFSQKQGDKKQIANEDVIKEIRVEITKLEQ